MGGFTEGFRLGYRGPRSSTFSRNARSVELNLPATKAKVEVECALGRLAGPFVEPPYTVFKCSPLSLRPKPTPGKYRLLHDLSAPYDGNAVNRNIFDIDAKVRYPKVSDAIEILLSLRRPYMAKADIKDAYRQIPLAPDQYWLVGFKLEGAYYNDLRLPMGARSSCAIFERVSNALAYILRSHFGVRYLVKMLDDFLFIGESKEECARGLGACESLFATLGLPLAPEKTVRPTRRLTFLGITLDAVAEEASIPESKVSSYLSLTEALARRQSCSLQELREVTGKLEHVTTIIRGGRAFLRRLHAAKRGPQRPARRIPISVPMKRDLRTWSLFLRENNARALFRFVTGSDGPEVRFGTDASLRGFGGVLGSDCIAGRFPSSWGAVNIEALECYPILALVGTFADRLRNRAVVAVCDNLPLVHCLNKLTSKNDDVMWLMRPLVLLLMRYNITLRAEHIPTKANGVCDYLSRHQVSGSWLRRHGKAPELSAIPADLRPETLRSG